MNPGIERKGIIVRMKTGSIPFSLSEKNLDTGGTMVIASQPIPANIEQMAKAFLILTSRVESVLTGEFAGITSTVKHVSERISAVEPDFCRECDADCISPFSG